MTSFIAAGGSGRSASVIPAVPAALSVTTIAFIRPLPVWSSIWGDAALPAPPDHGLPDHDYHHEREREDQRVVGDRVSHVHGVLTERVAESHQQARPDQRTDDVAHDEHREAHASPAGRRVHEHG